MIVRWLSEHRRLLGATSVLLVVVVVALLAAVAGSSAAPRRRHPVPPAALVATHRQLVVVRGQLQRLQGLSARQAAEISHLHAELRARRAHHRTRHHRR
jgi:hypothetical protein